MAYLKGKSVALVANAPVLLTQRLGNEIDKHDVVIRINGATPIMFPEHIRHIGTRTHILAGGRLGPYDKNFLRPPKWIWWMKVPPMGEKDRARLREWCEKHERDIPFLQWPYGMEAKLRTAMGAPATTGLRCLKLITHHSMFKSLDVYGMSFWREGKTSWYSGNEIHPSHDAQLEYDYFMHCYDLKPKGPGRWGA